MSRPPLARVAGPIAFIVGVLLLVQQVAMASFLDRSAIEATMANGLFVPLAAAYFIAFCGLLAVLVTAYSWEADEAGILPIGACPSWVIAIGLRASTRTSLTA